MTSLRSRGIIAAAALLCLLLLQGNVVGPVDAEGAVVRGLLIYDPTCENCEVVLNEVLPSLEARYADQLDIVKIDASTVEGFDIWSAGNKAYQVPAEQKGVPLLFLGDRALSGKIDIAEELPGAIEAGIAAGGVPLPDFVTLTDADLARWAAHSAGPLQAKPKADPTAFGLALVVLAGTVFGLLFAAVGLWRSRPLALRTLAERVRVERSMLVPALVAAGLVVAGYLSYLHLSTSHAICPVGNCDAVQQSSWSKLFGVPVAYLGFLTYAALLGLWLWARSGRGAPVRLAGVAILGIAAFGTAFSGYLTILELFVIHAVCMWCLVSAVLMTLILVVAAYPLLRPTAVLNARAVQAEPSSPATGGS